MITLTTFSWVPPFARGLVRDMRARWALEEAGLPYQARLIGLEDRDGASHRERQLFGQVPVLEEDGLVLFESGAILLHIAGRSEALMPADPAGRARAVCWVFAALNSMEPPIQNLAEIDLFHAEEAWAKARRSGAEQAARRRLSELAAHLDGRDWLEARFTAGDLMMACVLKILRHTDLVDDYPPLRAYLGRCESRPAYDRALKAHMNVFEAA
jgi:glutathione S-transferase